MRIRKRLLFFLLVLAFFAGLGLLWRGDTNNHEKRWKVRGMYREEVAQLLEGMDLKAGNLEVEVKTSLIDGREDCRHISFPGRDCAMVVLFDKNGKAVGAVAKIRKGMTQDKFLEIVGLRNGDYVPNPDVGAEMVTLVRQASREDSSLRLRASTLLWANRNDEIIAVTVERDKAVVRVLPPQNRPLWATVRRWLGL